MELGASGTGRSAPIVAGPPLSTSCSDRSEPSSLHPRHTAPSFRLGKATCILQPSDCFLEGHPPRVHSQRSVLRAAFRASSPQTRGRRSKAGASRDSRGSRRVGANRAHSGAGEGHRTAPLHSDQHCVGTVVSAA